MQLRAYYQIIRRWWWILLAATVLGVGGVALNGLLREPAYEATATIVENRLLVPVSAEVSSWAPRSGMRREERLAGLAALLQSDVMMDRVIRALKLRMTRDQLKQMVEVEPVGRYSEILAVKVKGRKPGPLPRIANALVMQFAEFYHSLTHGVSRRKREFLDREVTRAHEELQSAEGKLRDFKSRRQVLALDAQVNAEVGEQARVRAEAQTAALEIRRLSAVKRECEQALAREPAVAVSARTFSTNPVVQGLRTRLADQETKVATLLQTRTEQHADVINTKREIEALRQRLQAEARDEISSRSEGTNPIYALLRERYASTSADLAAAEARAAGLQTIVSRQRNRIEELAWDEASQARVLLDRDTARATYALLSSKRDQALLEERETASNGPVQIVDPASRAQSVSRLGIRLLLALLLSPLLGVAVILVLHSMQDTLHSVADVEALLHIPVYAAIPSLRVRQLPGTVAARPGMSEPYEMLRASLLYGQGALGSRLLAVASAAPGAGKSTVAANLAATLARDGHNVVLVDADLHRPSQHRLFELKNDKGLLTVLRGLCSLQEALQPTRWERLRVLTTGPLPRNPAALLSSEQMRILTASLQGLADVVLFDTPAGGAFADVFYIVALTRNVLLVTAAGQSYSDSEVAFRDQLVRMNARLVGSVVNKVRTERDGRYYYYYGYRQRTSGRGGDGRPDDAGERYDSALRPTRTALPAASQQAGGDPSGQWDDSEAIPPAEPAGQETSGDGS
jgi:capsular exopolysaccharide synthesis family protein